MTRRRDFGWYAKAAAVEITLPWRLDVGLEFTRNGRMLGVRAWFGELYLMLSVYRPPWRDE